MKTQNPLETLLSTGLPVRTQLKTGDGQGFEELPLGDSFMICDYDGCTSFSPTIDPSDQP